ncbi:acyltransferase [Streptomyces sp. SHP 1-2]|nr:acyltransferase [Streptomyces sp. SHP 1-2]MCW5251639.1 acyltransferase [Streptomyces sp. SHP 1-2]
MPSEPRLAPAPAVSPSAAPAPARGEHRYDIDLLRVLAAAGVILCHAAGELMAAVDRTPAKGAAVYTTGLVADAVSRAAVPLFFAIAGWVVLCGAPPRDGAQVRRRLTRIVVPMGVWTAGYLVWARLRDEADGGVRGLARDALFASVRPAFHLWYLYAYVPVVLLLSVAALVRSGKRPWGAGALLLGLALAPSLLGDAGRLAGARVPAFGWQFGVYQLAYAVAGAVLLSLPGEAFAGRRRRLLWAGAVVCGWAAVAVYEHRVHFPAAYASAVVALTAGAVLMLAGRVRVPERFRGAVALLAGVSFGAYLVHLMVLRTLSPWVVSAGSGAVAAVGGLLALTVVTGVLSFGAAWIWTRAGLARWLG